MNKYTIVGHVAIDRIITYADSRIQLGGPPSYSILGKNLLDYEIDILTCVGVDFPEDYYQWFDSYESSIRKFRKPEYETTKFVLDYRSQDRTLSVESICAPIDLDSEIAGPVIFSPIIGEVNFNQINLNDIVEVALDPQGLIRSLQSDGKITFKNWFDESVLSKVNVLKLSEKEMIPVTGTSDIKRSMRKLLESGIDVVIITQGSLGACLMNREDFFKVHSYDSRLVDPTGAGDCFLAGFFSEYIKGHDLRWCTASGSALASAVIETFGPKITLTSREVYERAEYIHEQI